MRSSMLLLSALALLAFAASPAVAGPPDALGVTYSDCSEFVGVDQMPQDIASALVPAEYVPLPYIIVRVVDCAGISVDGQRARPGRLMQIGVVVANGDPTAFVNNYQVWSATDHGALHGRLTALGVDIDLDHIEYAYAPGKVGGLDLSVSPPHGPAFQVTGVGPFARFPTPFVATWWTEGRRGAVKMRAVYDGVVLGFGAFTLTTDADSDLAAIAGRDVLTFANPADPNVLNTYNVFDFGDMAITVE